VIWEALVHLHQARFELGSRPIPDPQSTTIMPTTVAEMERRHRTTGGKQQTRTGAHA